MATDQSVLNILESERVFSIERTEDGKFRFTEECDHYFSCELTVSQVLDLANELIALTGV